jgi:hypothetical protein
MLVWRSASKIEDEGIWRLHLPSSLVKLTRFVGGCGLNWWISSSSSSLSWRGGEGRRGGGAVVFRRHRPLLRRRYNFDVNNVRGILASVIFGENESFSSTSHAKALAGARPFSATKWCVPGGLEVANGRSSLSEGGVRALCPCSSAATN